MSTPPLYLPLPSAIAITRDIPPLFRILSTGIAMIPERGKRRQPPQKSWRGAVLMGRDATGVAPQSNRCGIAIEFYLAVGPRDDRSSPRRISSLGTSEHPATIERSWSPPRGTLKETSRPTNESPLSSPRQGRDSEDGGTILSPYPAWSLTCHT